MILELKHTRGVHVVLGVDAEFCDTVVTACELRGEWFESYGDRVVAERLDVLATIWMVGHRHRRIHTRVAWLAFAADACQWYARLLRRTREDEPTQRANDACRQLRCIIEECRLRDECDGTIKTGR